MSEQDTQPSAAWWSRWMPGHKTRARLAAVTERLEIISDPKLRRLRFENGELNMELCGGVIHNFALMFAEYSRKLGAKNYISIGLHTPRGEQFEVTFQKVGAQTPVQVAQERKELCDELTAALLAAEEELRLIRMKDSTTVYNPMLRTQISLALARAVPPTVAGTPVELSNTDEP